QEGYVVIFWNIHAEATFNEIQMALLPFGQMGRITCPQDKRTGYTKGYAFVEYKEESQANKIIKACDQSLVKLFDEPLSANYAFCSDPKLFTEQNRNLQRRKVF
ncbi:MAG: proteasome regulatory particle subunit, partial [Paramarteilia canceri]